MTANPSMSAAATHSESSLLQRSYVAATQTAQSLCDSATRARAYAHNHLPVVEKTAGKVSEIVIPIIKIAATLLLFTSQSSMFVLGFLASILAPDFMRTSIERICLIWKTLSPAFKVVALVGGAIAFPITTAIAAFFVGGQCCLKLLDKAYLHQCQERELQTLSQVQTV